MKTTTTKTYVLYEKDVKSALVEYINLHTCGEACVDEDTVEVSFDWGPLDDRRVIPTITVKDQKGPTQ